MKSAGRARIAPVVTAFLAGTLAGGIGIGVAIADQPHMKAARHHLEQAREELQKAEKDKGGHREKAMDIIRHAIDEVQAGIDFDRHR